VTDGADQRPLRLLVVDDHEVVRQGLVALLDRRAGFEVIAQAGTVAEAIAEAARFEPDVVIMDVRMPDGSGIEACREIRAARPETRVVMLTSYPDEEAVLSAIIAGASGYLLKQVRGRDLVSAIESVGRVFAVTAAICSSSSPRLSRLDAVTGRLPWYTSASNPSIRADPVRVT